MTQQMDDLRKQFAALRDLHEREPSAAVAARHKSELDRAQQGARDAHGQLDRMNQQLDSEKEKARTMESAAQQAAKDVDGLYRQLSELKTYLVAEQKEAAAAIGDRENVIRVMRADIGDLQARVGADKAALNARDLDITRLKADLEASYDELQSERNSGAEKDREIGDMGKRLSGLHGELDSARNREAQLTDRIERLQATLGVKEDQLAKSNGMLADAKRNLDVSQAYGNKQASEVSRLESHAANLHSEISSLRKLLAELQAAKEGELQQMQRSSDEIQRQLCADRDHWKRVATEKEEQAAALQARTSDMERHIRSLRQEGKQNEEAIAAKEAELQETQAQLAEARHQLNLSQAAVADLEERIRRLRDQLSEAKRDADKQRLWYAEGLAAKDADIKQLQGGLSDLQRCLTAEQTLSRNLAADKEDQIARLERELDQERRVSQEALAVKEGEMADLKDFLASLRQQMARAETDAKDKGANVLRLQNQAADLDYRLSQQTKQLADRDAELGGLLERLSDLQLQLDTACLSSAEKDAQLQRLRAMLDDAQHGLEREKAQANQMAAYSNGEIQQLRQQLDQAERNARQAERENADSEKSLLAKVGMGETLDWRCLDADDKSVAQINDLKDKLAEAQRRSASDMVAIEDLRKQVDALKQELERSRQAGARESAEAAARAQKDLQSLVKCASDQIAYMVRLPVQQASKLAWAAKLLPGLAAMSPCRQENAPGLWTKTRHAQPRT